MMGWEQGDARLLERGSYVLEIKAARGFNLKIKPTGEQAVTTAARGGGCEGAEGPLST